MRIIKVNHLFVALVCSVIGAYATSKKTNALSACTTIPTSSGPSINSECVYTPSIQCCYIAAGSTSHYVTQTQNGITITIRRNSTSMVTIFGSKF